MVCGRDLVMSVPQRYAAGGRRRAKTRPPPPARARPLLPVYTQPKYRASVATRPYRVQRPPPFGYAAASRVPVSVQSSDTDEMTQLNTPPQFYFGEGNLRERQAASTSARTAATAKSSAVYSPAVKAQRIPAPDHQGRHSVS